MVAICEIILSKAIPSTCRMLKKINIFENQSFVAVKREASKPAFRKLRDNKIKGKKYQVRRVN
mgnify:CR=1 FL=1